VEGSNTATWRELEPSVIERLRRGQRRGPLEQILAVADQMLAVPLGGTGEHALHLCDERVTFRRERLDLRLGRNVRRVVRLDAVR
jgi:hypothetical protein